MELVDLRAIRCS